ncbi:MAG: N-acetylmuramoyl-L-alanine amidase [Actinomycetota bacterium]
MLDLFLTKNPKHQAILIVAASLILLTITVLLGYAFFLEGPTKHDAKKDKNFVTVPALVGKDMSVAKKKVESAGLKFEVDQWVNSKVYPIKHVISQKPLPNVKVKKGSRVIVNVSGGKDYYSENAKRQQSAVNNENLKPLPEPPIQPRSALIGKVVVIDPGHQRKTDLTKEPIGPGSKIMKVKNPGGTLGTVSKVPEYELTLSIAKKIRERLQMRGVKVVMTRESNDVDIGNIDRARIANNAKAELFVRIHANGDSNAEKSGISTLYPALNEWTAPIYDKSLKAAKIIQKSLIETTKQNDLGIVARNDMTGFNWSKVPVVLIETGFMTNPKEDVLLNSPNYQDHLAKAISDGIIKFLQTYPPRDRIFNSQ